MNIIQPQSSNILLQTSSVLLPVYYYSTCLGPFLNPHLLWYEPKWLILISSDQTTFFQSSKVHCWCLIAKSNLSFLWCSASLGLFFLTTAFIPTFFGPFWIVCVEIGWLTTSLRDLVIWTAFSALPEPIRQITWWMSVSESFVGQPPEDFWRLGQCLEWILEMVALETPVWDEIWWPDRPESMRERICCFNAGVNDFMVIWSCSTSCYGLFVIVQKSCDIGESYFIIWSKLVSV